MRHSGGSAAKSERERRVPFAPPAIGEGEIAEVVDTLRSGWITTGPKVHRFEQEFAHYVDSPAALAVNSGTGALHLALTILGVGPGDCVVTTPMTFCSSVHVIEHVGARPILVDVEPETLNIDVDRIAEVLDREQPDGRVIKALLPVHLYGHPCDMEGIAQLAREHDLAIVEDAAHALPARYRGRLIGGGAPLGDSNHPTTLTCFSFYATKNLTTAEGGMLTGDPELIDDARVWSLHGMNRDAWKRYGYQGSWHYDVTQPGFKYNMTDIQAAIGLHQLRKLPAFHARRREIAGRYDEAFARFDEIETPREKQDVQHAWHLYVLRFCFDRLSIDRGELIDELRSRNVEASVHFIPIHLHQYYREKYGYRPMDFPVAYRGYERMVSIPLYPSMSDEDVESVIDAISTIVESRRKRLQAIQ